MKNGRMHGMMKNNEKDIIDELYDDIFYLIDMNRKLIKENIKLNNELLKMKKGVKTKKWKIKI